MNDNDVLLRHPMRNKGRFAADFNRWVYETCNHEFYFGNIDGYSIKVFGTKPVLRIWENKHHRESISPGQMRLLREMAMLIHIGISQGKYHPASGVYIVYGNPTQDTLHKVVDVWRGVSWEVDTEQLKTLVECSDIEE